MAELEHVPPHAVDAILRAYRYEGRRLAATERAVDLVELALRGESVTSQPVKWLDACSPRCELAAGRSIDVICVGQTAKGGRLKSVPGTRLLHFAAAQA
jgi:hypothetical protein